MSDPTAADYYARLGIDPTADAEEVQEAARDAQKRHHPDHNADPDSSEQFQRVREATECLTDHEERTAYDVFHDRFGPARAATAFERWTAFGRVHSPGHFSPGFSATDRESETTAGDVDPDSTGSDGKERTRRSSRTDGAAGSTTQSTGRSTTGESSTSYTQETTDAGNSNRTTATSSGATTSSTPADGQRSRSSTAAETETDSSRQTHSNFGYRQNYEREEYDALHWTTLRAWPNVEVGQIAHEVGALVAIGLVAAIGLALTTILAIVLVFGTYVLGTAVAVLEFGLRSAGIARFEAFTVTEIGLTWVLELGVYAGALFAVAVLFEFLFDRDWDAHLGNRLGIPRVILLLPGTILAAGFFGPRHEMLSLGTPLEPVAGFLVIAALWPGLHRSVRLLLETVPNHSGESLLDSSGVVAFYAGAGSFLLAAYLLGGRWMLGSLDEALEYSFLMRHLSPELLLAVGFGVTVVSATVGVVATVTHTTKGLLR